jgi:hypothetical protein
MDSGEHDGEAEVSARKALTKMARLERQDKSRTLLGGRMGRKSRNNNARGKGAHAAITLVNAIIRWEICELDNLRFDAP